MTDTAELLLAELCAIQQRLDTIDAPIAAAYLDSAIEALCRECGLERNSSIPD
jgi:hypothetical protein